MKPLRVLLVEDMERDAALLNLYLRRGGYNATLCRVETSAEMRTQLESSPWDVIISDFNLPHFGAAAALKVLQESGRDIPFIVLSGGLPEHSVHSVIEAGARRYLPKDQIADVVSAIEREIGRKS